MAGRSNNVKLAFQYNTPYQLVAEGQFAELIYKQTYIPIVNVVKDNSTRNQVNGLARIIVLITRVNATKLTSQANLNKLGLKGLTLVSDSNLENLHTVSIYKPNLSIKLAIQRDSTTSVFIREREVEI